MSSAAGGAVGARTRPDPAARRRAAPYWNPYVAGFGIGLVLLATFVVMGRGLGATGAFSAVLVWLLSLASSEYVQSNAIHSGYWNDGAPLAAFLVYLMVGVLAGAGLSGVLAGRARITIGRGPRISDASRLAAAFGGGFVLAFGAKLALGCTSGQGLTGGAMFNVGSWAFLLAVFVGGFALAPLMRRAWL
jgi:uncharacterized membrane protein YedE/YeeE